MKAILPLVFWLFSTFVLVAGREEPGAGRHFGSWAECEGPVCSEVQRQAEGLTRLKLLRNYVVQTMQLMDSLVTSLDEELVKTGQGISSFIGPRCQSAHPLLQHITKSSISVDRLNNVELREDLEGSESSQLSSTSRVDVNVHADGKKDWENEIEDSSTISQRESDQNILEASSSSHHINNTRSFSGQPSAATKIASKPLKPGHTNKKGQHVTPSHLGRGRDFVSGASATDSDIRGGGGVGLGGKGHGLGSGSSGSRGSNDGFGGGHGGSAGASGGFGVIGGGAGGAGGGFGGGGSGSVGEESGFGGVGTGSKGAVGGAGGGWGGDVRGGSGVGCRGIDKGLPQWVPGLDDWCASNCAAAYCPSTHCIC